MRIAAERFHRLEIVQHHGVVAGLGHRRHRILVGQCGEPLRPGAGLIVLVPIKRLGQLQAVRGREAKAVDVGDEDKQSGELLAALDDAELGRLLDRVDRIAAGIGEADDLCFRGLRLQQIGGEIGGVERHLDRADDLAAIGLDDSRRVALEGVAEGIIGGDEEPGVAPRLDDGAASAVGERDGVVGPMHRGR